MQALVKTLQSGYNVNKSDIIEAGIAYKNPMMRLNVCFTYI